MGTEEFRNVLRQVNHTLEQRVVIGGEALGDDADDERRQVLQVGQDVRFRVVGKDERDGGARRGKPNVDVRLFCETLMEHLLYHLQVLSLDNDVDKKNKLNKIPKQKCFINKCFSINLKFHSIINNLIEKI